MNAGRLTSQPGRSSRSKNNFSRLGNKIPGPRFRGGVNSIPSIIVAAQDFVRTESLPCQTPPRIRVRIRAPLRVA